MIHRLRIVEGPRAGEVIELTDGEVIAGRVPESGIYLPSQRVSRKHCSFTLQGGRCVMRDLGSANGVQVNNQPMPACELVHGTYVQIGDVVMVYEVVDHHTDSELTNPTGEPPELSGLGPPQGGFGQLSAPGVVATSAPPLAGLGAPPQATMGAPLGPTTAGPVAGASPPAESKPMSDAPAALDAGPPPFDAGGLEAQPPSAAPSSAPASGNPLLTRLPFMARVVGLFMLLGLVLLCGPGGGFLGLASGGASNLEEMSVARGVSVAEGLGHRNVRQLAARGLDYELGQWERLPEVKTTYLLDPKGGVVAPTNMANKDLSQDPLFKTAKSERREAVQAGEDGLTRILVPVRGPPSQGAEASVLLGYAYIEYDAAMAAAEIGRPMSRLILSFLLLFLAGAGAIAGVWLLAERPLSKLRDEAELAISGHAHSLQSPVKWGALEALTHTINRALARAAGQPEVVELVQSPAEVKVVVEPDGRLPTLMAACTFPVVLLDPMGRVQDANDWGQHLFGSNLADMKGRPLTELVSGPACDKLSAMWTGISQGQAPVLADDIDFGQGPRTCTLAAGPELAHAVLVVL